MLRGAIDPTRACMESTLTPISEKQADVFFPSDAQRNWVVADATVAFDWYLMVPVKPHVNPPNLDLQTLRLQSGENDNFTSCELESSSSK